MRQINLRIDYSRLSANIAVELFKLLRLDSPARLSGDGLIIIHGRISGAAFDKIWRLINRYDVTVYQQLTPSI